MKKPRENRTISPTREPTDMFKPMITGTGSMKITISMKMFRMAFVQLYLASAGVFTAATVHLPMPEKVDASPWYGPIICALYRRTLKKTNKQIGNCPAN
jgi:hypothetical protein